MKSGIYKIQHRESGKLYIGSSSNIKSRLCTHRNKLRHNQHHNILLQNAFNKYGEEVFEFIPIVICSNDNLLMYEQLIIDGYGSSDKANGYNLRKKAENNATHGLSANKEYRAWQAAIARCNNPNDDAYKSCGGRGIRVCSRWIESFDNFREDMGKAPIGSTLSRKDTNKNYELSNCEWTDLATRRTRNYHKHYIILEEERMSLSQAVDRLKLHGSSVFKRMRSAGETCQQAIDYFSKKERHTKFVEFYDELIPCSEVEKRLGLYQGAINCRIRRNKETHQQATDYWIDKKHDR